MVLFVRATCNYQKGGKLSIDSMIKNYYNLTAVLKGGDLGKNWKNIKDTARVEQFELKKKLSDNFQKLYRNAKNKNIYWYAVWYILKTGFKNKALRDF